MCFSKSRERRVRRRFIRAQASYRVRRGILRTRVTSNAAAALAKCVHAAALRVHICRGLFFTHKRETFSELFVNKLFMSN